MNPVSMQTFFVSRKPRPGQVPLKPSAWPMGVINQGFDQSRPPPSGVMLTFCIISTVAAAPSGSHATLSTTVSWNEMEDCTLINSSKAVLTSPDFVHTTNWSISRWSEMDISVHQCTSLSSRCFQRICSATVKWVQLLSFYCLRMKNLRLNSGTVMLSPNRPSRNATIYSKKLKAKTLATTNEL